MNNREKLREEFEKETGKVADWKWFDTYVPWLEARLSSPPLSLAELGVSDEQLKEFVRYCILHDYDLVYTSAQKMRDKLLPHLRLAPEQLKLDSEHWQKPALKFLKERNINDDRFIEFDSPVDSGIILEPDLKIGGMYLSELIIGFYAQHSPAPVERGEVEIKEDDLCTLTLSREYARCPKCEKYALYEMEFCPGCGSKITWLPPITE